ncbi:GNAT family N-acetyltransferase [Herbiconiux sp. SYSU D00978]|uniref:GNAT family N-acetyltransferase n=1 Tax=Herbiconiux sp. SYSU D00978 TaxID=2812562 RepID=UPI001A964A19|nr:GNAT family N-acetyltransferase [Herbiconiux sp. SYSU D00978]
MTSVTIEEIAIPATLDAPGAEDFVATVDVRNAVETDGFGTAEFEYGAAELLPSWLNSHEPKKLYAARVDGRIVARAIIEWEPEGSTVWLGVQVLPEFRGRGIGSALADRLEQEAVETGATKALVYTVSKQGPGERLAPPTGAGSVPAGNTEVRFLLARGYELEQVERCSRLALPLDPVMLRARLDAAHAASGADYRVHEWGDFTPEEWLDDIAMLETRMTTDAPTAGLEEPEVVYTAERIRDEEKARADSPRRRLVAAVEHVPTGRLAGFTVLEVPAELDRPASQDDTLVLREHRGHRLGMLLKVANLAQLERVHPGHPSVTTFNAEENRHMLSVNEAVGFVPIAYEGAWRKDLAAE